MKGKRATLLVNPTARRVAAGADFVALARFLEVRGVETRVVLPKSPEEATAEARRSADHGDDFVFALGGDGTQRSVAEGLAGSETALAALPGGTVNIWCMEAGIPRRLRSAVMAHLTGQVTSMDLGRAGSRVFMLMASVGWDAAVARRVSFGLKRWLGWGTYLVEALRAAPGFRPVETRWRSGMAVYERPLALLVASNTRLYGGRVRFSPGAVANDGLLDVVALCPQSTLQTLQLAVRLARSSIGGHPGAIAAQMAEVSIETAGLPFQLDGDYAGETPVTFRIEPGALIVSVPAGRLPRVLGG